MQMREQKKTRIKFSILRSHLSISFDVSVVYFLDESLPFGRGGRDTGSGARRPGLACRLRSASFAAVDAASEVGQPACPPLEGLRRREWGD